MWVTQIYNDVKQHSQKIFPKYGLCGAFSPFDRCRASSPNPKKKPAVVEKV